MSPRPTSPAALTARLAGYVLPAASPYEKWEATLFTLEFSDNVFHLRAPLLPALEGTLPEPEICARTLRHLRPVSGRKLTLLRATARRGRRPCRPCASAPSSPGTGRRTPGATCGRPVGASRSSSRSCWRLSGLRIHADHARDVGLDDADALVVRTRRGSVRATVELSDRMRRGHVTLPNGFGLDLPAADGTTRRTVVALNELTDLERPHEFAGTPWHKHVPARVEPLSGNGSAVPG